MDRVFVWSGDPKNFMYQLVHSYPPGTMDTSLVSTDYINNPRTMNAVYLLGPRLDQAKLWGKETLKGGELNNKQLVRRFQARRTRHGRRASSRTDRIRSASWARSIASIINIGLYSEEWMTHFNPFFGGKKITPIEIATAEKNSAYWRATEAGTPDMAKFLLKAGRPDHLGRRAGRQEISHRRSRRRSIAAGRFSPRPARAAIRASCPTKRAPSSRRAAAPGRITSRASIAIGPIRKTDEFKAKMRAIVAAPDFLKDNYLSTEARIPVTLLRTNACSPLGTNAIRGNIWDNFSSATYKTLPSVGRSRCRTRSPATRWQLPRCRAAGLASRACPRWSASGRPRRSCSTTGSGPFSDDPSVDGG